MDTNRRRMLDNGEGELTKEEIAEGWHFCYEWDFMLIGSDMPEMKACCCGITSKGDIE